MARTGKDLDDFDMLPAERYVNEPPWRWSSKKRTLEDHYPRVAAPAPSLDDDDSERRLADYITPDTLEIYQTRARRKEAAKTLLKKGQETAKTLLKRGNETGKVALEKGGTALATGGRALVQGAQMASEGIRRYSEWVAKTNAEALVRQEQEQKLALERRRREVERRKAAMEIQREQQELAREERRFQLEMAREEAQFRREFGGVGPQQGPARQQGPMFGYGAPQQPAPFLNFGYRAPQQPAPFLNFGTGIGTPAPGFRTPAEIVGYDGGMGLPPSRRPASQPSRQKKRPAKNRGSR